MHRLRALLLALLVLPLAGWEPLWRVDPDVADGRRAYAEGRYDEALDAFDRAEGSGVDPAGLDFDRGTTNLARAETAASETEKGEILREAVRQLENATRTRDKAVKARAHYNLGNLHMKAKQLDDAIDEYKHALRADATLESARSNLELALRQREKERKQQQQRQGQGQGQGQGQSQQPNQGQGQGQGQPQQGQGQGQQPQPGQQGQPQQGNPQNQGQGQPQPQQGQPNGNQGQPGSPGGPSPRRMPQAQWPQDDTESDTPQVEPRAKLDQLEDMSRQLRRDRIRQKTDGTVRPQRDW